MLKEWLVKFFHIKRNVFRTPYCFLTKPVQHERQQEQQQEQQQGQQQEQRQEHQREQQQEQQQEEQEQQEHREGSKSYGRQLVYRKGPAKALSLMVARSFPERAPRKL